jgi:pimeloyl-ACP methyl ester carboxylesterase
MRTSRRHFFGTVAMSIAAVQLGGIGSVTAQAGKAKASSIPAITPGAHTSFGPLKQVDAGLLHVAYAEAGPAGGRPVILLHGWPYDIHSDVDVAPALASAGYRVIVPYLRGYGSTRFLAGDTVRNGQPAALAGDVVDLMDALKIEKAILGGFDWGARTGDIVAALARAVQGARRGERIPDRKPGGRSDPVAADGGAAVVVPVLLRDRARPGRLRQVPTRFRQADLADRVAEVEVQRCHVRSQRGRVQQSGSRGHRGPQLPLEARTGRRRAAIRGSGEAAGRRSGHHRPHHHARR